MGILPLKSFFPEVDEGTLKTLAEDPDFIRNVPALILKNFGKEKIFPADSSSLPIFFSRASFASEEEQIYVSQRFKDYFSFDGKSILPRAVDYLSEFQLAKTDRERHKLTQDFGSKCLFSLAIFSDALEKLHNKGAPDLDFYRHLGPGCFESVKRPDVAVHFYEWEGYVREKAFAS